MVQGWLEGRGVVLERDEGVVRDGEGERDGAGMGGGGGERWDRGVDVFLIRGKGKGEDSQ